MPDTNYPIPVAVIGELIEKHGHHSVPIKNALSKRLSELQGHKVSNSDANRLLTKFVDDGLVYRISHKQKLYYTLDPAQTVGAIVC